MLILAIMLISQLSTEQLEERYLAGQLAWHDMLMFAKVNTPDQAEPWNIRKSKFEWKKHHAYICEALQDLESGKIKALEIELPPRAGKSELAVRNFVSWHAGKHPDRDLLIVTATADLATEHGRDVRDYMLGPGYRLTFGHNPKAQLRQDSQSANRLQLVGGAKLQFYGRGQIPRGVGGFGLLIDDIFKSSDEIVSEAARNEAYRNVISDCFSRLNNAQAWKLLIGTRTGADDVQGRMFDPTNPHYDEAAAKEFTRIRIPALSEGKDVDPLGREKDEVCWPERFPKEFYLAKKHHKSDIVRMDFQTQDQCNPFPEEGIWFKKSWIKYYDPTKEPKHFRNYVSSDHAYRIKQKNDKTCILKAKISPTSEVYISPETYWKRCETDEMADEIFRTVQTFKPAQWWAARDAISGSILPLLRRRQLDEKVFFYIDDSLTESKDLVQRSASIRGLMAMGMVYWPLGWPQLEEAIQQLLSFPSASDDLVAALAMLGMGMDKMLAADGPKQSNVPPKGTMAWHTWGREAPVNSTTWR